MTQIHLSYVYIGTALVIAVLSVIAHINRKSSTNKLLSYLLSAVSIWTFFYGLELGADNLKVIQSYIAFEYIGIAVIPVFWLLFVSTYCYIDNWISRGRILLLFTFPIITIVAVTTNSYHYLFYSSSSIQLADTFYFHSFQPGPFYWLHIFYSYTLVLLGVVMVIQTFFRVSKDNRNRVLMVLFSSIIPYLLSVVYIVGIRPEGNVDYTPFGFLVMAILITLATFNKNHLNIKPFILNSLYDSIPDAILVADTQDVLISTNPRAKEMIQKNELDESHIKQILNSANYVTNVENDLYFQELASHDKTYRVEKSTIQTPNKKTIGTMYLVVDITQEKKYRDALRRSEEQYRLLIENAQEAIIVVQNKVIMFNNPMMCTLTNYCDNELLHMHISQLVHPDDTKLIYDIYDQVSVEKNSSLEQKLQFRLMRKDKSTFWIEFSYVIIQWKGAQAGLLFIKDVNQHKQNEELKELLIKISNTYINASIDDFNDLVSSSLREMSEFVNADRAYVFDYDLELNTCSNTFEWCAEGISAEIDNLQNVPLSLIPEWVDTHKNGLQLNVNDVMSLEPENGIRQILEPQGVLSILTIPMMDADICIGFVGFDYVKSKHKSTEKESALLVVFSQMIVNLINRKKSNDLIKYQIRVQQLINKISSDLVSVDCTTIDEKIKRILNQTGEFFDVDRSYILRYSNNANIENNTHEWCKAGVNSQKESIVNVDLSIFPWWKEQIEKKEIIHIVNTELLPPEASAEKNEFARQGIKTLLCFPIISNNNLMGYFGFDSVRTVRYWDKLQIDMIETLSIILGDALIKVETELELIRSKELAEAASVAKSNFLSNMSHEIRTPLNGVIGFTELLRNTHLNKLQKDYLENTITSANSLLGVISDILDFSKIESGKMELECVKTDIIQLFENSSDIVKVMASNKNLELLLNIDPSIPRFAYIDPIRTKQILVNLLTNAVKFTQVGEIELSLHFQLNTDSLGVFFVSVRDTGIGIKDEDRHKLFKAFSQADTSTTRRYGGTGLGLIISNSLAKQMGGNIEFESDYGVGTNFHFNINCKYEYGEMPDYSNIKNIQSVLIVDDNINNRIILEQTIKFWKLKVISVESGLQAVELLSSNVTFDLIIVDYHMPEMDGIETIRSIRSIKTAQHLPVIMLHSSSDVLNLHQIAQELNVLYLLTKPVKHDELYYYINSIQVSDNEKNQSVSPNEVIDQKFINKNKKQLVVMVAEDTNMNMILITNLLNSILPDIKVFEAVNGIDAIQLMKTIHPDIVFMDVQMPELDGLEATKQIRKLNSGKVVPIIALTAGVSKEERELCFNSGMNDFLAKPIERKELKRILLKYMNSEYKNMPINELDMEMQNNQIIFDKEKLMLKVGNIDVYESLLQMAKVEYPKYIQEIKVALDAGDAKELKQKAHKLKGSALNMEFVAMGELTRKLEENADNMSHSASLFNKLIASWEQLLSEI